MRAVLGMRSKITKKTKRLSRPIEAKLDPFNLLIGVEINPDRKVNLVSIKSSNVAKFASERVSIWTINGKRTEKVIWDVPPPQIGFNIRLRRTER